MKKLSINNFGNNTHSDHLYEVAKRKFKKDATKLRNSRNKRHIDLSATNKGVDDLELMYWDIA